MYVLIHVLWYFVQTQQEPPQARPKRRALLPVWQRFEQEKLAELVLRSALPSLPPRVPGELKRTWRKSLNEAESAGLLKSEESFERGLAPSVRSLESVGHISEALSARARGESGVNLLIARPFFLL